MPVVDELADTKLPVKIDGTSLVPVLIGSPKDQKQHKYLYWEYVNKDKLLFQAVRMGDWKCIKWKEPNLMLFDLKNDPAEKTDVAASHPDIVKELAEIMKEAHTPN
jgi:arylsulfatase A-like enzyme